MADKVALVTMEGATEEELESVHRVLQDVSDEVPVKFILSDDRLDFIDADEFRSMLENALNQLGDVDE